MRISDWSSDVCSSDLEGWDGFFFIAHVHERRRAIAHSFQKKIECEGKGHGADTGGEGQEQPCLLSKGWSGCGDDGGKPRGYRGHFNETHRCQHDRCGNCAARWKARKRDE